MRPFWHPVSAVLLPEPRAFATQAVLRLLLRAEEGIQLVYAGDRMSPTVRDGGTIRVARPGSLDLARGDAVIAVREGIPDLYRVDGVGAGQVVLGADADPEERTRAPASSILAVADLARRTESRARRSARRWRLDLAEALGQGPDTANDAATTVRDKYDGQAAFYRAAEGPGIEEALLGRLRGAIRPGGRVLVAGSGSGREALALATDGFEVLGIDFAPAMIRAAREEADRRRLAAQFLEADLRRWTPDPESAAAIFFTYDVYSFIPSRDERVQTLRNLARALEPSGSLFLSARRVRGPWDRAMLTLLRAKGRSPSREWGAAHTRYIDSSGALRRSFVRVFSDVQLRDETTAAGLVCRSWSGGHGEYRRAMRAR